MKNHEIARSLLAVAEQLSVTSVKTASIEDEKSEKRSLLYAASKKIKGLEDGVKMCHNAIQNFEFLWGGVMTYLSVGKGQGEGEEVTLNKFYALTVDRKEDVLSALTELSDRVEKLKQEIQEI